MTTEAAGVQLPRRRVRDTYRALPRGPSLLPPLRFSTVIRARHRVPRAPVAKAERVLQKRRATASVCIEHWGTTENNFPATYAPARWIPAVPRIRHRLKRARAPGPPRARWASAWTRQELQVVSDYGGGPTPASQIMMCFQLICRELPQPIYLDSRRRRLAPGDARCPLQLVHGYRS